MKHAADLEASTTGAGTLRENKIQSGEEEVGGELRIKQEVDSAGEEEEEEGQHPVQGQHPVKGYPYAARPGDYLLFVTA